MRKWYKILPDRDRESTRAMLSIYTIRVCHLINLRQQVESEATHLMHHWHVDSHQRVRLTVHEKEEHHSTAWLTAHACRWLAQVCEGPQDHSACDDGVSGDTPEQVRRKAERYTGTWTIDHHLHAVIAQSTQPDKHKSIVRIGTPAF